MTWPDHDAGSPETTAVAGGWLQVTVLANDKTGLPQPDVFYFGNAVGESGDSPFYALVNATEALAFEGADIEVFFQKPGVFLCSQARLQAERARLRRCPILT